MTDNGVQVVGATGLPVEPPGMPGEDLTSGILHGLPKQVDSASVTFYFSTGKGLSNE